MKEEFIRVTESMLQGLLFRQPGQLGCQSIYPGRKWPWRFSLLFMMSSPPNLSRAAITHFYYCVDDQEDRNVFCGPESWGGRALDPGYSQLPWSPDHMPSAWPPCKVLFLEPVDFCQTQQTHWHFPWRPCSYNESAFGAASLVSGPALLPTLACLLN